VVKNVLGSGDARFFKTEAEWQRRSWPKVAPYSRRSRQENYVGKQALIVEELLGDSQAPNDLKFFVFNGGVKCIQVDLNRHSVHKRVLYSEEWERLPFNLHYPVEAIDVPRPKNFNLMSDAARKLAEGFGLVRIDFYEIDDKYYVGELTHFHGGGGERVFPRSSSESFEAFFFK
jgi:hypothetical protein